jgi:hypothetical protein
LITLSQISLIQHNSIGVSQLHSIRIANVFAVGVAQQ